VRAIDRRACGGCGTGVAYRVRRALLVSGPSAGLRRELEISPPDAPVVFDPHDALALTFARDQGPEPSPLIGRVRLSSEPSAEWPRPDAGIASSRSTKPRRVALADAGVEANASSWSARIGERTFANRRPRVPAPRCAPGQAVRKVALLEVAAGLRAHRPARRSMLVAALGRRSITWLFERRRDSSPHRAGRRQVPILWPAAPSCLSHTAPTPPAVARRDVIVARPRSE